MAGKRDVYSGIPWEHVPGDQVRAHPKGKLNAALWLIAAYLLLSGGAKVWILAGQSVPIWVLVLGGILPFITGLGLIARMPMSIILAVVLAGVGAYSFLQGLRAAATPLVLVDGLIAFGILGYLLEGERPNFIYRHRFRKYSALTQGAPERLQSDPTTKDMQDV